MIRYACVVGVACLITLAVLVSRPTPAIAQASWDRFEVIHTLPMAGGRMHVVRDRAFAIRATRMVPPSDTNIGCFYLFESGNGHVTLQPTPDGTCW